MGNTVAEFILTFVACNTMFWLGWVRGRKFERKHS